MKKIFLLLTALFIITSLGYAQECHGTGRADHPHKHKMHQKMKFEMLNLSNEQRDAIENASFETRKKIIPLRSEIELKRLDLEKEMKADEPNRSKIMKTMKEISDLDLKIKQTEMDQRLHIHSMLTPEQKEQLKKPLHKAIKEKKHNQKEYKE
ncbi:periplasmic heavy metal sensor [candidate division WOR-3 bacterium]|nr:periplasmic heavy metal sensor [candidate division WOR-3 bacterium]MCK4672636.1 periplasmic heavy metal sensor [candidate division WOR-3 bacterium]